MRASRWDRHRRNALWRKQSFYASTDHLPPFDDYALKGRTYRYFAGTPLYPFGYGLSYTSFKYTSGRLSTTALQAGDSLAVSAKIKNNGGRDGDETVKLYLVPKAMIGAPLRILVGFEKIHLHKGETKTVQVAIAPRQLSLVLPDGSRSVHPGEYELYLGVANLRTTEEIFLPFHIEGLDRSNLAQTITRRYFGPKQDRTPPC
jgi:beta-glucosidase